MARYPSGDTVDVRHPIEHETWLDAALEHVWQQLLHVGTNRRGTAGDRNVGVQSENNVVGLAEATPAGNRETGRFEIPDKGLPNWSHPVISGGRLYVRNQDILQVYDIKSPATP